MNISFSKRLDEAMIARLSWVAAFSFTLADGWYCGSCGLNGLVLIKTVMQWFLAALWLLQLIYRKHFEVSQHRKMAAVDMECYGVYYAAAMTAAPTPKTICIKSVSDLADREKSDDLQNYCSYMSACVALELIKSLS